MVYGVVRDWFTAWLIDGMDQKFREGKAGGGVA